MHILFFGPQRNRLEQVPPGVAGRRHHFQALLVEQHTTRVGAQQTGGQPGGGGEAREPRLGRDGDVAPGGAECQRERNPRLDISTAASAGDHHVPSLDLEGLRRHTTQLADLNA